MENQQLINFFLSSGGINPGLATEIASNFQLKLLGKNDYFLKEGQLSNEYLVLEKGYMRSFCHDTEGREVSTGFYSGLQPVFEVNSFFNRTASMENYQALTDCQGWVLTFAQLNKLFHAFPEFREFGRSILVKGFAGLKMRMLSMITETAESRYATLLKTKPEVLQNVPLKHIASYLGVTDTSLSRIRKDFAKN